MSRTCIKSLQSEQTNESLALLGHLISAPVPDGRDGHAQQDARPREVGVDGVAEQVEGVLPGDAAGGVGLPDGGDGGAVTVQEGLPTTHLCETSTQARTQRGASVNTAPPGQ